jgi:putative chitinase
MLTITPSQLQTICLNLHPAKAATIASLLNELCPKYGMDTADKFHEFIAQVAHESREFAAKDEDLQYSAKRLMQVWPSRFPSLSTAIQYANDSRKLANNVYANRMGNGNALSGDGFRFRGGGFIQLTGRSMYTKYAKYKGIDVSTIAAYVRQEDRWALDSALWVFCIEKGLLDEAERDEFITITRSINGGDTGIIERRKYYERAKAVVH